MSWPTTTTSTTNIDADSDSIAEARFEIFKNFKDVNSITDEFNIGTPSNKDTLIFNSNTNKFDLGGMTDISNLGVFEFSDLPIAQNLTYFTGTFAPITGSPDLDITSSTNSDGHRIVTFPAGNYVIQIPLFSPAPIGTASSGGQSYQIQLNWQKLDGTNLANLTTNRIDFNGRYYSYFNSSTGGGAHFTLTQSTDVRFEFKNYNISVSNSSTQSVPDVTLRRL